MARFVNPLFQGKRASRAIGILFFGLALFLLISLVSYSIQDYPNSSRAPEEGGNWGGRIGTWIAYGAFQGVGYTAYVLPAIALLWSLNRLLYWSWVKGLLQSFGLLSMALLMSAGAGLPRYSAHTTYRIGGWLGIQAGDRLLIPYGGRLGSAVFLAALFIAALSLTTDLELRAVLGWLRRAFRVLSQLAGGFVRLGINLTQWMVHRLASQQQDSELEADGEGPPEPLPQIGRLSTREETADSAASIPVSGPAAGEESPRAVKWAPEASSEPHPDPIPPPIAGETKDSEGRKGAPRKKPASMKYAIPGIALLDDLPDEQGQVDEDELLANARLLEAALSNFDVGGKVVEVSPGPVVTRYEVEPAPGVKVNRIVVLADDLARVLSANGIRIQAPVPGKSVVGVEIANKHRETVYLREILESKVFTRAPSKLTMALGKTISGEPWVTDLTRMPHLLVAGATGSGKSVCINGLICSILFKSTPAEVRFLMVDPKVVELAIYNDIPHLLAPVVTEPKKAAEALKWAVAEMEVRYRKLAELGVRNLADYNGKLERQNKEEQNGETEPEKPLPYLVIVIDEFADLMLTAPAEVETSLMSLAQKSRAVGIHIILATQRPSVNVITGVIKANFPSRIAFQVASKTDSRTILDMNGAERLLGRGDMLFLPGGQGEPVRIHGAFVSGEETERLVEALKTSGFVAEPVAVFGDRADIRASGQQVDELFGEAVRLVIEYQQASTSFLQRRMKIGYSRAARLMDELEAAGIVGPAEGVKPRQLLVAEEDLDDMEDERANTGR